MACQVTRHIAPEARIWGVARCKAEQLHRRAGRELAARGGADWLRISYTALGWRPAAEGPDKPSEHQPAARKKVSCTRPSPTKSPPTPSPTIFATPHPLLPFDTPHGLLVFTLQYHRFVLTHSLSRCIHPPRPFLLSILPSTSHHRSSDRILWAPASKAVLHPSVHTNIHPVPLHTRLGACGNTLPCAGATSSGLSADA